MYKISRSFFAARMDVKSSFSGLTSWRPCKRLLFEFVLQKKLAIDVNNRFLVPDFPGVGSADPRIWACWLGRRPVHDGLRAEKASKGLGVDILQRHAVIRQQRWLSEFAKVRFGASQWKWKQVPMARYGAEHGLDQGVHSILWWVCKRHQ